MGVLNVTPDSFSDGGLYRDTGAAIERALRMQEEGAHLIDVGAESSRPGARPVGAREEIRRLRPVLKGLARRLSTPISVDTYKYDVASMALDEGARLVNDIRALKGNRRLARRIASAGASVALMHMRGTPPTMQKKPVYGDVLKDVRTFLSDALERALDAGIPPSRILLDPGFGFGKTPEHNLAILANLDFFLKLKYPLLVGLSRKSFIGRLSATRCSGAMPAGERLYGSLGAAAAAIARGAHILRVHDVAAHRQLAAVMDAALETTEK